MLVTLPRALAIPAVLVVVLAIAGAWVDGSRSPQVGAGEVGSVSGSVVGGSTPDDGSLAAGSAPSGSASTAASETTDGPSTVAGTSAVGAAPRTSCTGVVHIGDSTSVGLMAPNYLEDPATRIDAQYAGVGVTDFRAEISGGRSIVERLQGQENADEVAVRQKAAGFDGCWVLALGTTDAANMAAGAPLPADKRIDRMMAAVGDDPVLWVNAKTLVTDGAWSAPQMVAWNEALTAAAARYPNLAVYDWASVVQDPWFQDDGIHYTSAGYAERARLIAESLATTYPAPG